MVFSPFTSNKHLITKLATLLRLEVAGQPHYVKVRVDSYITYLKNTYLADQGRFSYEKWDYFYWILEDQFDTTNNVSESLNRTLNRSIKVGFKTYSTVVKTLYKNKVAAIQGYTAKVVQNRLNIRRRSLREKMERRREIIGQFNLLSNSAQVAEYETFLGNIKKVL